ncbi:MAG: type II toxin-antitoxin system RelE/ParE family toxin [Acidobacteria bacterium]|nr:type II toxin-antitoxin system RelE/ParE family toxin [Acidobacteriota bacterium]
MENYKLLIKPSAVKEIETIPKKDRARITANIQELAANPRPHGGEKLSGEEKYRLRQGSYRIIYSIDDSAREVLIVRIGHRKDIYR